MDIKDILQSAVQDFILQHEVDDENKLLLKHKTILGVPAALVADQIVGRRKAKLKLQSWYASQNILYPPSINIEQSSSEKTAAYKIELLRQTLKVSFKAADLTGGFGVDSFFFASIFNEVDYVEPDQILFELVRHNHNALGRHNIQHHNTPAEIFLSATKSKFDLVYIDPSRRSKGNQKIFRLTDCTPDITLLQDDIFNKADLLLVKASPMIDLQQGARELKHVVKIYVVAVDNECKEILFLCRKGHDAEPVIEAIDLKMSLGDAAIPFNFLFSEEKKCKTDFSKPLRYLYEPNAALLKAGAFKLIAQHFSLIKIQQHTHLYTSDKLVGDFSGRIFEIEALVKSNTQMIRTYFPEGKANVITRNYPLSPEQLKKKTGLKDGGENFLIGFSGETEKFTAVCRRIK